jgi:molecular chaperone HscA
MAKLEITFRVDADGLLAVNAKELTTASEQTVTVKPSYGLDDAAVEKMLLDALDHGEDDLRARRLAEARLEAHRLLTATAKAVRGDASLLEPGDGARIEAAMAALESAARGDDPARIQAAIDALDKTTNPFAARRMNRAIAQAIEGRRVDDVAQNVATGD